MNHSILPLNSDWPQEGVRSLSTEDIVHKYPSQYLAELLMINRDSMLLESPYFWKQKEYQTSFAGFIIALNKRLKTCEFRYIHNAIVKNNITSMKEEADSLIVKEILEG